MAKEYDLTWPDVASNSLQTHVPGLQGSVAPKKCTFHNKRQRVECLSAQLLSLNNRPRPMAAQIRP